MLMAPVSWRLMGMRGPVVLASGKPQARGEAQAPAARGFVEAPLGPAVAADPAVPDGGVVA
jgi:hypothetical protein